MGDRPMAPYPKRTKYRHDDHATWDQAEWNQAVRGETELETRDRQFTELVQEPRVAQTGVQILFAFLLGLAFTPRFPDLSRAQQGVYLATLVLAAVSAALLIAPVGYHRTVFRQRLRPRPGDGDSG